MNKIDERLKILKQAVNMQTPDRIAHVSNIYNWVIVDSPYTIGEAFNDPDKIHEVWVNLQEKYNFDSYLFETLITNYVKILEPLGGTPGRIITDIGVNKKDIPAMSYEELDEFAKNPYAFMWTTLMKRRFPLLEEDEARDRIKVAAMDMIDFMDRSDNKTRQVMKEKLGVPSFLAADNILASITLPVETLYSMYSFRGIKNTAMDMRRNPGRYKDILDQLAVWFVDPFLNSTEQSEYGTRADTVVDSAAGLLAHNIMSEKQFEMFVWPHLKVQIDALVAKGKVLELYVEGEILRFAEFFQDIPKGHIVLYSENDNIFELRKKLPNVCLLGGMPLSLLGSGSKEDCIDYTKKLIDELGRDGGFILSQDKMVSFANDCKVENLKAVSETLMIYGARR